MLPSVLAPGGLAAIAAAEWSGTTLRDFGDGVFHASTDRRLTSLTFRLSSLVFVLRRLRGATMTPPAAGAATTFTGTITPAAGVTATSGGYGAATIVVSATDSNSGI